MFGSIKVFLLKSISVRTIFITIFLIVTVLSCDVAAKKPKIDDIVQGELKEKESPRKTVYTVNDNTIVYFKDFDIPVGEQVQFFQPNATSRVLVSVKSGNGTSIDGKLFANGILYLVNPHGITFGRKSVVEAYTFYAVAGEMSFKNFLRGNNKFHNINESISARGKITANGVHLIARKIEHIGSISSPDNAVTLLVGDEVYLAEREGHFYVRTYLTEEDDKIPRKVVPARNSHSVIDRGDIFSLNILNLGEITGEEIIIKGPETTHINISGVLDVSQSVDAGRGGSISVFGEVIELNNATVDASGTNGGGSVFIGQEQQTTDDAFHARKIEIDDMTFIRADAISKGNGGYIFFESGDFMQYGGEISARGGTIHGDGGVIKLTSYKDMLSDELNIIMDTMAPQGSAGQIIFDPPICYDFTDQASWDKYNFDQYGHVTILSQGDTAGKGIYIKIGSKEPVKAIFNNAESVSFVAKNENEKFATSAFIDIDNGSVISVNNSPLNFITSGSVSIADGSSITASGVNINAVKGLQLYGRGDVMFNTCGKDLNINKVVNHSDKDMLKIILDMNGGNVNISKFPSFKDMHDKTSFYGNKCLWNVNNYNKIVIDGKEIKCK
jgi:filamentous hemagglutinin family protein